MPDGELRFEIKFVSGVERAFLFLVVRTTERQDRRLGYVLQTGPVLNGTVLALTEGGPRVVGLVTAPHSVSWGEWNTIAVRLQGSSIWLIVNDLPISYFEHGAFADGGVVLSVNRNGDVNDEAETAAVFRNMRVSALEGSERSRAPVYDAPQPTSGSTSDGPDPNRTCDHGVPKWEQQPDGRWMLWCDQTDWTQQ
jgi:hypothetical protein